jgi:hypothetical protein
VVAVATAVGFDRFHVVGHDFGGAIAWIVADRYPQRILSVTSLSTPHPAALAEALNDPNGQWWRSSYIPLYQTPFLPELLLGFNRAAYLQHLKWQWHSPAQVREYKRVFGEPGALRGALNWYRAFQFRTLDPLGKIRQPTLLIWGKEDGAFGRLAVEKTANYVDGPFRFHKLKAGHWLMLEAPQLVADQVLTHLRAWSQHSEQKWNVALANLAQRADSPCDQSRPHCLNISVSPNGDAVRIRNRCKEQYQGTIRVFCTGWISGASVEYRFSLGENADVVQESNGFSFGDCYYRHRLCATRTQD